MAGTNKRFMATQISLRGLKSGRKDKKEATKFFDKLMRMNKEEVERIYKIVVKKRK